MPLSLLVSLLEWLAERAGVALLWGVLSLFGITSGLGLLYILTGEPEYSVTELPVRERVLREAGETFVVRGEVSKASAGLVELRKGSVFVEALLPKSAPPPMVGQTCKVWATFGTYGQGLQLEGEEIECE